MKDDLIKKLIEANKRLFSALDNIHDDVLLDRWSKKEVVAHIAGWYEETLDATEKILNGKKPISFRYSLDGFNKRSIKKRKNKTTSQIVSEAKILHKKFIELLQLLEDNKLKDFFGTHLGKKQINVLWVVNEIISHDNSHAEEVEKLLLRKPIY